MKFVLAPDSFKENMSAVEAARAMELGVRDVFPDARCVLSLFPCPTGGEGFIEAVGTAWDAQRVEVRTVDALGRADLFDLCARGRARGPRCRFVLGPELIAPEDRDVARSNTAGLGLLIRDALARGAKELLIGIGGSATNDAGAGMLYALGARFFDAEGGGAAPIWMIFPRGAG